MKYQPVRCCTSYGILGWTILQQPTNKTKAGVLQRTRARNGLAERETGNIGHWRAWSSNLPHSILIITKAIDAEWVLQYRGLKEQRPLTSLLPQHGTQANKPFSMYTQIQPYVHSHESSHWRTQDHTILYNTRYTTICLEKKTENRECLSHNMPRV